MEQIKFGIIGIGNRGTEVAQIILNGEVPHLKITAIADRNPARIEWAKENIPGAQCFEEGMDLLDSTPRQLYLYELLGKEPPEFYHVPLLLSADGRRLSKRDKDLDLGVLRQKHTPEEILGRLAHLAGILDTPEAASAKELAKVFAWDKVKAEPMILREF